MTNAPTVSKFTLPAHMILGAEVNHAMPKAAQTQVASPSAELMAEMEGLLKQLHPDDPHPKRRWITVLIVIFYETAGHPAGFALANAWSRRGRKYKGPAGVRKYWKGMKPCPKNPLTIATLRWMVDQRHEGIYTNQETNNTRRNDK
ncbi:MAG: PriCT-2 domain-containing protein [Rhodocyclales bacterium]|nr:PriCT-2 domain-containing protein [Rhodocyclales bacterium]